MAGASTDDSVRPRVDAIYRTESRRVFATLVRVLGDFDLAEESLHDAFAAAVERWPVEGIPDNPRAWLISAGRFRGIDAIRRREKLDASFTHVLEQQPQRIDDPSELIDDNAIGDDRLRLIFTCCHPALPPEARLSLTLREVCGLTTEEIARAFFVSASTIAQRIVRAKTKIKAAKIPYHIPSQADLPDRIETVLQVIYLLFNEGYSASSGESVTRADLSSEAIRLGRLLMELLDDSEVIGIVALMLLQESRRAARTTADGQLVLLEDQDRSRWDRAMILEGVGLVQRAMGSNDVGAYTIQAAIAAVHAQASALGQTNWSEIVALYDLLLRANPSPVVELNRAVAVGMLEGPEAALTQIDQILSRGELADYHLAHSARAEMCRRVGRNADAAESYHRAIALVRQEPERRFLVKRLAEIS